MLGLAWFAPRAGDPIAKAAERFATRLARRKTLTICAVALAVIPARLALLPIFPVPVPVFHDEFSYLLEGDTFAHGRLTNPPHPMGVYFDTFHVLQHPTYQSMYPPAQGAVIALGIWLGHPWIGVLLSVSAMCAAITWMLQAWFPSRWALLGGVFAILRFGLCSYWTDSYWGGAVAAIGGALIMGALPRIMRHRRHPDAVIMGIGAALLANSRPFEGLVFCLPVAAFLIAWLLSARGPELAHGLSRVVAPLFCVMALTLVFIGYYNWRLTGSAVLFPHTVEQREKEALPVFIWQSIPARHYSNPQLESFNAEQVRTHPAGAWGSLKRNVCQYSDNAWEFFAGKALPLPFLTLPWLLRDKRIRLPLVQIVICLAGFTIVTWFQPHYAAPMSAALMLIIVQGMRHLRRWEIKRRPIGIFLSRLVVVLLLARIVQDMRDSVIPWSIERDRVEAQLKSTPGNHLAIVRYSPQHNVNNEWVFNAAEIDASRVVWAREIPGMDLQPLLNYYHDRNVWMVNADSVPPRMEPYQSPAQ